MSGKNSSTITPGADGGTNRSSAGTPRASPHSPGLSALIAATTNPPVGLLGATMYFDKDTFVLFVDIVLRAFDSVNREMLWKILKKYGIP